MLNNKYLFILIQAMTALLTVICPFCRKHTQLNENNTFELPNNYYIIQLMDNKTSSVSRSQIPATNLYIFNIF